MGIFLQWSGGCLISQRANGCCVGRHPPPEGVGLTAEWIAECAGNQEALTYIQRGKVSKGVTMSRRPTLFSCGCVPLGSSTSLLLSLHPQKKVFVLFFLPPLSGHFTPISGTSLIWPADVRGRHSGPLLADLVDLKFRGRKPVRQQRIQQTDSAAVWLITISA